jgi:hypothetical protein
MKSKLSIFLLSAAIFFSCMENKKAEQTAAEIPDIVIKEILATSQDCNPDSLSCTYVRIEYPVFTDSARNQINLAFLDKMREISGKFNSEEAVSGSPEHMAQTFILDYEAFNRDFPDNRIGWYVNVKAEIVHESTDIITYRIDAEYFTGGAHQNSSTNYYVLDAKNGRALNLSDIVSDTVKFKNLVETAFRRTKGMEEGQSYADIGFYIDDEQFVLSRNIGVTDDGIVVHFNPYEIAPYSLGATSVEVKNDALGDLLKVK